MARRRRLTTEQWRQFLFPPTDEREIVRHHTLGQDDLDEEPHPAILAYLARQVGADASDFAEYRRRGQTRREHLAEIIRRTGHRTFDRSIFKEVAGWLVPIAQTTKSPVGLAAALVDEMRHRRRRRRVLLSSADVLELVLHRVRGRAERVLHQAVTRGYGGGAGSAASGLSGHRHGHDGLAPAGASFPRRAQHAGGHRATEGAARPWR